MFAAIARDGLLALYTAPGIYKQPVDGLPHVETFVYAYTSANADLRQQAVPPRPYYWSFFKELLQLKGFTKIKLGIDGVISAEINQKTYYALPDYRVTQTSSDYQETEIVDVGDLNGDRITDLMFHFVIDNKTFDPNSLQESIEGFSSHSQAIYVFPNGP